MSEWQPIETAPKDETDILVYLRFPGIVEMFVVYWDGDGWCYAHDRNGDPIVCNPLFWMPLPSPPGEGV
jgi:hypothetical protein